MGAQATNSIQKLEYDEATNHFTTVTIATTALYTSSSNQWHEQWRIDYNSLATIGHIVNKLNAH
jgi:hypothetical protein